MNGDSRNFRRFLVEILPASCCYHGPRDPFGLDGNRSTVPRSGFDAALQTEDRMSGCGRALIRSCSYLIPILFVFCVETAYRDIKPIVDKTRKLLMGHRTHAILVTSPLLRYVPCERDSIFSTLGSPLWRKKRLPSIQEHDDEQSSHFIC